ncbi:MAG: TauD/TfdA family dioxygenase [Pseudonocardiaceae bacterium]
MIDLVPLLVEPGEFIDRARRVPDCLVLCQFSEPLTHAQVRDCVAQLSFIPIAPGMVDVRTVTHTPSITDSTALSLHRLALHTDGAFLAEPPPRVLLSCTRTDDGGKGASTFIPVDFIVDQAPDWVLDGLERASFRFLKTYDGDLTDSYVGPVLTTAENDTRRIRWRADQLHRPEVVDAAGTRAADAASWLHELVETCEPFRHVLRVGELVVVPNGRVVHGRAALCDASRRELLRAWIY